MLLVIADDVTGALDTGVQFAARGAATRVMTDPACIHAGIWESVQVLVLMLNTRHVAPKDAYNMVYRAVREALDSGCRYIYKKTDSALRGNIGSELSAVMDAAGMDSLPFVQSFPKMNRITQNGIHYIDGIPVAESVFGQDPFEPVRHSSIAEIIHEQTNKPVVLCPEGQFPTASGIHVYDAATDSDLRAIGNRLGSDGLRISAGCAGFASVLADVLDLNGEPPALPVMEPPLFVVCGSVNPITIRQMDVAEQNGFVRVRLTPEQKLNRDWQNRTECGQCVRNWIETVKNSSGFILDANDPVGVNATGEYAEQHRLTTEDMRVLISSSLGALVKKMLDAGLNATMLCTGGDTLLSLMRQIGVSVLKPICEVAAGTILTDFTYKGRKHYIISKSGGFGAPELFCELSAMVESKIFEEELFSC